MYHSLAFLLALIPAAYLAGSSPAAPASPPPADEELLVLRGGRVFDPVQGERRPVGQLWVRDGRVVGEHAEDAEVPEGARVVDVSGCTLVPGLFDLHAHVAVPGGTMAGPVWLEQEENLATHLYCGVLHVVDLHNDQRSVFELRDASRTSPSMARLYAAGAAFTAPEGHATQFGVQANTVTSTAEVRERFEALLPLRPDVVKGILERGGWASLPELPTLSAELITSVGEHARAAGLPFFCHVWRLDEAKTAVRAGATALAHGVFVDPVDDELAEMMKAEGTVYVPTLAVATAGVRAAKGVLPYANRPLAAEALHPDVYGVLTDEGLGQSRSSSWAVAMKAREPMWLGNLKTLHDAGVAVATGTDCGNPLTPHGPALLFELELFVEAGLTPAEALRAATLTPAELLGVAEDFGDLGTGKVADVVVVEGDPTRDVRAMWHVRDVYKAGVAVDRAAVRERNERRADPSRLRVLAVGEDVPERIDGFDDGDTRSDWGGSWEVVPDTVAPGGKSTGEVAVDTTHGTLVLTGSVNEGFQWGAWSGIDLNWSPGGDAVVDATGCHGLRLRVKGTPRNYSLTLKRQAVKDWDNFATSFELTGEWQVLDVPFEDLKQMGFGARQERKWNDLIGLTFNAHNPFGRPATFGEFELHVDYIELYERGAE